MSEHKEILVTQISNWTTKWSNEELNEAQLQSDLRRLQIRALEMVDMAMCNAGAYIGTVVAEVRTLRDRG